MWLCWDVVANLSDEAEFGIDGQTEAGFQILAAGGVSAVVVDGGVESVRDGRRYVVGVVRHGEVVCSG